ncbi:ABC transporter permease [Kitasatospora aureofaciens]|uniref:ABC transporter permease n=1 Tax=Kitasatospora aureofaciens TaxID=1894 RepID=UPI001D766CAE|nr:ABC transporter permease [Kitasatospora aureofaciens]HJD81119.1 ABC transporter permease [Kitasatospora aureofaciens]
MSAFRAGVHYQWMLFRARPSEFVGMLVATPFITAVLLSVVHFAQRADLAGAALLAPALASLWSVILFVGGQCIVEDRGQGRLELILTSPTSLLGYLWGRVSASVVIGLAAFGEAWLVGVGVFGARPVVLHPWWFAACLLVTAAATVPMTALLAGVFALGRGGGAAANFLSYPLYVLAGIFTPAALLPDWLHPVSRAFYLSWGADLARSCLNDPTLHQPGLRLAVIAGLGLATAVLGVFLLRRIIDNLRTTGMVSL